MDTDKEAEESPPKCETEQKESSLLKKDEDTSSLKRKLEKDTEAEIEDDQPGKRPRMEGEDGVKEDMEVEAVAKEENKPEKEIETGVKGEESGPGEEKEAKVEETGKVEPAEPDSKAEGSQGVDYTEEVAKEETSQESGNDEQAEKVEEEKANSVPESSECKQTTLDMDEEKDAVQRRYPTRSRQSDGKTGPEYSKVNGSKSDCEMTGDSHKTKSKDGAEGQRAASVKSDSGSDKENVASEAAMDLSNAATPDVIMLSDEEDVGEDKKRCKKDADGFKLVRRLQTQLRNEEAKLVLLKKLRQSQLAPQVQEHGPISNSSNQVSKQSVQRQQGGPPPLVRGGQQGRTTGLHLQQQQGRNSSQGQLRNVQGPPPLVSTRLGSNNTNGHSSQSVRNTQHMGQHGSSAHRPGQQQAAQQAATPPQQPVDTQTPAQRQAAAKLALRKQLEKTLLQIPPPKPPAPEMNFIPSLACPDFVLLLGLEEVVNHIIDLQLIARGHKSADEKFICNPFTCVQCGTDYTPVWKREKPGSKNVICEHCVTWNQKRALKQEHTNRLKSAFVKALQQEQEIERMQAQAPSNPSTPTPSATPPSSMSSAPPQALAAAAAANNVAAATAMNMNQSFRPSAEQVRQHQNFMQQAHQLRAGQALPGLQGFGARGPFPYSLPYVKQADLQRQYLLDMIPRAGMPWKP